MKKIILIPLILIVLTTFSQSKTTDVLAKYNLTPDHVLSLIDLSTSTMSFDAASTTTTIVESTEKKTQQKRTYTFDGKKTEGEKYTLLTYNGETPSKKKIKKFNKEKNSTPQYKEITLSEKDFFIKSEDDKMLIIGFNVPEEQINSKIAFMAHCTGFIAINKESKKAESIEIKNNEGFNLKIFHVTNMDINITLAFNETLKEYYLLDESTQMVALLMGSTIDITIEEKFTNFKF